MIKNDQNKSALPQAGVSRRRFFTASSLALGAVGISPNPKIIRTMACAIFILMLGYSGFAEARTEQVATASTVGLSNGQVALEFDRRTGALVSLKNQVTGDDYIKEPNSEGNPFRAYVDTTKQPHSVTKPYPCSGLEDDLGGQIIEPKGCQLTRSRFERKAKAGVLTLTLRHPGTGLEFEMRVRLRDGDVAADLDVAVRNTDSRPHTLMTAAPCLTGLGLGPDRASNQGMRLVGQGQSRAPAWADQGGLYGQVWSMQWDAVYDAKTEQVLGVIIRDPKAQNKIFHRFKPAGMSVLYFPQETLLPGASITYPTAQILVYRGSWKSTARRYGQWFSSAFKLHPRPQWFDQVNDYVGIELPSPEAIAKEKQSPGGGMTSFRQLPRQQLQFPQWDIVEWVGYFDHHGTYTPARADLGGTEALRAGVAVVHSLGGYPGLYVAATSISPQSRLVAGTNPQDWFMMDTPQAKVDTNLWAFPTCPGYQPWVDHLAEDSARLVKETGVKSVRLDEFGQITSSSCFNPAHHHTNLYDGFNWHRHLGQSVRAALDKVDRDCVLLTENCTDVVNESCDATLILWSCGKEIAPMRLAVPNYRGVCGSVGQVECALNGWVSGMKQAANDKRAWSNGYHDVLIGPGLEKRPPGYHSEPESDRKLLWHQLSASFPEAAIYGDPTDIDPTPLTDEDPENWGTRLWRSKDYWLLVAGHLDAWPLKEPTRIKLPELPKSVTCALEFDTETLAMQQTALVRESDGIYVTIHSGFAAVLLPLPGCPPLVQLKEVPPLQGGQPVNLELDLVAPWRQNLKPQSLMVEAPGLQVLSPHPTAPGRLTIQAPRAANAGDYPLRITGRCLPLKRWFHKADAAAAEAATTSNTISQ